MKPEISLLHTNFRGPGSDPQGAYNNNNMYYKEPVKYKISKILDPFITTYF